MRSEKSVSWVHQCSGTYFLVADFSPVLERVRHRFTKEDEEGLSSNSALDFVFCRWMIREAGVGLIPLSPFFVNTPKECNMIRFCFAKTDDVLRKAIKRLKQVFK